MSAWWNYCYYFVRPFVEIDWKISKQVLLDDKKYSWFITIHGKFDIIVLVQLKVAKFQINVPCVTYNVYTPYCILIFYK